MKLEFKPEDFKRVTGNLTQTRWEWAAEVANARLAEMLEQAPEVFGRYHHDGTGYSMGTLKSLHSDNLKARLVNIENIGGKDE